MMRPPIPFVILLLAAATRVSPAQTVYARQHDVLVDAIKTGHSEGVLQGPAADLFTKQFRSDGQLLVVADVVASYSRPDCKRLQMIYTKKNVVGPRGLADITLNTRLNYCLDGRPPVGLETTQ